MTVVDVHRFYGLLYDCAWFRQFFFADCVRCCFIFNLFYILHIVMAFAGVSLMCSVFIYVVWFYFIPVMWFDFKIFLHVFVFCLVLFDLYRFCWILSDFVDLVWLSWFLNVLQQPFSDFTGCSSILLMLFDLQGFELFVVFVDFVWFYMFCFFMLCDFNERWLLLKDVVGLVFAFVNVVWFCVT